MTTYQEYKKQIAELEVLAEAARKAELAGAKEKITALMREHGLSANDLVDKKVSKAGKSSGPVAAKYRDAVSGKTWTGRGRMPTWMNGQDKEKYLIK